jgi:hypothetical protein
VGYFHAMKSTIAEPLQAHRGPAKIISRDV